MHSRTTPVTKMGASLLMPSARLRTQAGVRYHAAAMTGSSFTALWLCTAASAAHPWQIRRSKSSHAQAKPVFKPLKDFMPIEGSLGHFSNQSPVRQSFPPVQPSRLDGKRVFFKTYGCQMNVNDSELAWSILQDAGCSKTNQMDEADIVLLVTCAIRENAESKIWMKLDQLSTAKKKRSAYKPLQIGVLGCMAERLKHKLIEESKCVDIVAGPDAYRELPTMLSRAAAGETQVNVLLSLEETYADLTPVRHNPETPSAFVSIQRGCDNMCSYCIVPFTRGRERSRPVSAVLREVQQLSDQGVKEVILLGQNVNSYLDHSEKTVPVTTPVINSRGFKTLYKRKKDGLTFAHLLEKVAKINTEMRVRFTSPHPKDFPDEVLHVIREYHNVCNQIHLPAQSGSSSILERMRRGYTNEAYRFLVDRIRTIIPDVTLSSDFITGFCGETEQDHQGTVDLLHAVKYDMAYLFAYSLRERTHAHRQMTDDVPESIKQQRLTNLINVFHEHARMNNEKRHGTIQTVLVESVSKRSAYDVSGRTDGNIRMIVPKTFTDVNRERVELRPGDYVLAEVTDSTSLTLRGQPLMKTSLRESWRYTQKFNGNRMLNVPSSMVVPVPKIATA